MPSTWPGIESGTSGIEGQRYTNSANQADEWRTRERRGIKENAKKKIQGEQVKYKDNNEYKEPEDTRITWGVQ
ncbi:hypothetical protein ANN_11074 [Periplaneta americana]|uniref:Uncharacterized protein n=1 Tax=Periplaneta americana TaxID=6978 RepID=A0ABQ8T411_PERAM|nr:hypothetical protein ANN_11074 [Periplaneta americana]